MTVRVGTSGWSYPSWRPGFYPAGLDPARFLGFYAERFPTVELNTTGYRLPAEAQFRRWAEQAPDGFEFAPKLPGHRLRGLDVFESRVRALDDRLGPVRISLTSARDEGALELLLGSLDPSLRLAFDLEHPLGLRAHGGSVVVLGDKKQSIYAFRGNEGHGLDTFPELVSGAVHDHLMDECQRCPAEIVALANDVMAYYNEPLQPVRGPGAQVHVTHFGTPHQEHKRIAAEAVRAYRAHPDKKHLVLVTRRRWGYAIRDAIRECDPEVTAQTVFAEDILETWPAREAFVFLSVIGDPLDPAALRDWLSYQEPNAEGKKWKAAKRNAPAYISLWETHGVLSLDHTLALAERPLTDFTGSGRGNVHARLLRLKALYEALSANTSPQSIVDHILDPEKWVTANSAFPDLAREDIERLHREVVRLLEENANLSLKEIVDGLRSRIATREPLGQEEDTNIKIVTLWGAKGLTADFVYIVGLCDEALPGAYDPDTTVYSAEEHELEQLRLLYVSLTRAKESLVISRPTKILRGEVPALGLARRPGPGYCQPLRACRFFANVPPAHLPVSVNGANWAGLNLP